MYTQYFNKTYRGAELELHVFLTPASEVGEMWAWHFNSFAARERAPVTHGVSPRAGLDAAVKSAISLTTGNHNLSLWSSIPYSDRATPEGL